MVQSETIFSRTKRSDYKADDATCEQIGVAIGAGTRDRRGNAVCLAQCIEKGGGSHARRWKKCRRLVFADKFAVVLETAALNGAQLSEYCRRKGLFAEQIEAWREVCATANARVRGQFGSGVSSNIPTIDANSILLHQIARFNLRMKRERLQHFLAAFRQVQGTGIKLGHGRCLCLILLRAFL